MSLYVVKVYSLSCDMEGCDAYSDDAVPQANDMHKAETVRQEARRAGWRSRGGFDFCPLHADQEQVTE